MDVQVNVTEEPEIVAPSAGFGALGVAGGVDTVVNDQTGPFVAPAEFRDTTCQKYLVELVSPDGVYDALLLPLTTGGGGFDVPKLTS